MGTLVFYHLLSYIKNVVLGIFSVGQACMTILPYLFKMGSHRKRVTENYPDPVSSKTPDDLPPKSRGLLFNDIDICTGCRACEKICPSSCIRLEVEPGPQPSKLWVSIFDIDFGSCSFCGLCVEACEPGSIIHTRQYEAAAYGPEDLIVHFGRGHVTSQQRKKWETLRNSQGFEEKGKI